LGLIEDTPVPINQHEDEFSAFLDLYKKRAPMRILEIGTYNGGTLYHWITQASHGATIVSIDNQHVNKDLYPKWAANKVRVEFYNGYSETQEAIQKAKDFAPYDWIFIDADHSYNGVKSDWVNYSPMINKGGIVAFHDILPHPPWDGQPIEVEKLWAEIKEEHDTLEIIGKSKWPDLSGIGVVFFD